MKNFFGINNFNSINSSLITGQCIEQNSIGWRTIQRYTKKEDNKNENNQLQKAIKTTKIQKKKQYEIKKSFN